MKQKHLIIKHYCFSAGWLNEIILIVGNFNEEARSF